MYRNHKKNLATLFATIFMLRGRMNFRNLARYSVYSEMTHLWNFRKSFDFQKFNRKMIGETVPDHHKRIAAGLFIHPEKWQEQLWH
jgi:hypothetical protein